MGKRFRYVWEDISRADYPSKGGTICVGGMIWWEVEKKNRIKQQESNRVLVSPFTDPSLTWCELICLQECLHSAIHWHFGNHKPKIWLSLLFCKIFFLTLVRKMTKTTLFYIFSWYIFLFCLYRVLKIHPWLIYISSHYTYIVLELFISLKNTNTL